VLVIVQRYIEGLVEFYDRAGDDKGTAGSVGFVHSEAVAAGKVDDFLDLRRVGAVGGGKRRFGKATTLRRWGAEIVGGLRDGRAVGAPTEHDGDASLSASPAEPTSRAPGAGRTSLPSSRR
jgi:hypothetical protein